MRGKRTDSDPETARHFVQPVRGSFAVSRVRKRGGEMGRTAENASRESGHLDFDGAASTLTLQGRHGWTFRRALG